MLCSVQRVLRWVVFGSALCCHTLSGHAWAEAPTAPEEDAGESVQPPLDQKPEEAEKVESVASGEEAPLVAATCATNLTRPASEVLVEIGEEFAFSLPYKYVEVRTGESLCVELASEETGGFSIRAVAVEPESHSPLGIVLTQLEEPLADGTVSTLSLTNHLKEPLSLNVARPQRADGVVLFEKEIFRLPARSELIRRFDFPVSRVLVGSIPQASPPEAAEPRPPFQEDPSSVSSLSPSREVPHEPPQRLDRLPETGVRESVDFYVIGGSIFNHSSELEDVAIANDFGQLPHRQELLGFGVGASYRRVRFVLDVLLGFPRKIESLEGGPDAKQHQSIISLEGGYDVFRYRGLSIFPLVGLNMDTLGVRTHPDGPALFPAQNAETYVRRYAYGVRGTLGVQNVSLISPRGLALVYGLRVGYQHQFAQSKWLTDEDETLSGGPKVQTSGVYAQLLFGISFFPW